MASSPRTPGQKRFLTKAWCEAVDAELAVQGWSRSRLAKELGVAKPIVSRILNMTHQSSPYVDAICELLKVPLPDFLDARDAEVIANLRLLRRSDPAEFDRIAGRISTALARNRG